MTIFDNCIIQAPDGVNLSRCCLKKLKWYVSRGLADLVGTDPYTVRLRFEPSGRHGLMDPLLQDGKPNNCLVCGTTENLTRHHMIPYCFIKHMKPEYQMDIVRDIFPLCRDCHDDYEKESEEKRNQMARDLGLSRNGLNGEAIRNAKKIISAAIAILNHGEKMPEARRSELMSYVREYLGKEDITTEDLKKLREMNIKEHEGYVNFSKFVAENVTDYSEFAREWRTHFVETMNPKHLPSNWKIDRKTEHVWVPARVLNRIKKS